MKRLVTFFLLSIMIATACSKKNTSQGRYACQESIKLLRSKVGPEFGKIIQAIAIPIDENTYGCALRFNRIAEELPGEVLGNSNEQASDELAIMLKDTENRSVLRVIRPPRYRTETVKLSLLLRDVHVGQAPELLVLEKAKQAYKSYQALRVFNFAKGVPIARKLFSERLLIKTPEGITLVPQWKFELFEDRQALIMQAGGEFRIYMWHDGLQKFKLDLAASQRKKMKGIPSRLRVKSQINSSPNINKPVNNTSNSQLSPTKKKQKKSVKDLLNDL